MEIRHLMIVLTALFLGQSEARAQEPTALPQGDSVLHSLIAEALAKNLTIAQRQAAVRAASLRIRPAGSLPDPMLTVGVMDLVLPRFDFNRSDFTELDIELMQDIPWPGTLRARSSVARANASVARADEEGIRRDVIVAVARAYYRLRYVATALELLREQQELLDAAVQLSTTRYATGAAPQSDPLQAKLARDRLRAEAWDLESELVSALAAVNALRNRPPDDSLQADPLDPAKARAGGATLADAESLAAAVATHPRVAIRRAAVDQATREIQVQRLGARPDFTLTLRYGYRPRVFNENLPDFFSAFLGVRLPIWAGRKQNRLADAARADSGAAAAELLDADLQLRRDATETAARVNAARRRLELLVDGILPTARGAVESVIRSYQVGRAEFLTVVSVEDALYRAQLEAAAVTATYLTHLVMLRQLTTGEQP